MNGDDGTQTRPKAPPATQNASQKSSEGRQNKEVREGQNLVDV